MVLFFQFSLILCFLIVNAATAESANVKSAAKITLVENSGTEGVEVDVGEGDKFVEETVNVGDGVDVGNRLMAGA